MRLSSKAAVFVPLKGLIVLGGAQAPETSESKTLGKLTAARRQDKQSAPHAAAEKRADTLQTNNSGFVTDSYTVLGLLTRYQLTASGNTSYWTSSTAWVTRVLRQRLWAESPCRAGT